MGRETPDISNSWYYTHDRKRVRRRRFTTRKRNKTTNMSGYWRKIYDHKAERIDG
jgi:hypothetical protein